MKKRLRATIVSVLLIGACLLQSGCGANITGASTEPAPPEVAVIDGNTASPEKPAGSFPADTSSSPQEEGALPLLNQTPAADPQTLRVLYINVRKADAILVQYGGANVLIDTGTEESAPYLLGALHFMGVTAIDALALTHTHKDHIGGVPALAKTIPIKQAFAAEISENKKNGENKITEAAKKANIPLTRLTAGDTLPLANGVVFDVIGPLQFNANDDNDNSLVLRLTINGRTLLFTGDMQFAEESTLLSAGVDVSAHVLKVGNHGNPDATGDQFAEAVSPQIAVISTNTAEDDDSANPRVIAALKGANTYVTQNTVLGVLLTLSPDGTMDVYNAAPEPTSADVKVGAADPETQTITLKNRGDQLDISGWMLLSDRGGELMVFPEGSVLEAGATAVIAAQGGSGDFIFAGEDAPWHKKKADIGILYDQFGQEVTRG